MFAFAAVFALCAVVDFLWLRWTHHARKNRAGSAALYSGMIQIIGLASVLLVVDDRRLFVANVLGHAFGSYVGVRWNRRERDMRAERKTWDDMLIAKPDMSEADGMRALKRNIAIEVKRSKRKR